MSHLVAIAYDDLDTAQQVVANIGQAHKAHDIELEDLVIVERRGDGKVKLHQPSLAGAGAVGGALWGGLIGLIFLMPLFGMAIGAASGAAGGALADTGVDDKFMKDLGDAADARQRGGDRPRPPGDAGQGAREHQDPGPHHPDVARQRDRDAPRGGAGGSRPMNVAGADEEASAPERQQQRQRVELYIPTRTLLQLAVFGVLVALAILSLGTLLSIFLAAVLALGLDPVVAALVQARLEARAGVARGVRGAVRLRVRRSCS